MANEENQDQPTPMELIRAKLETMGYSVRSSTGNPNVWYAITDTRGEAHAVILENDRVKVNDINGTHYQQRQNIEVEVNKCLNP